MKKLGLAVAVLSLVATGALAQKTKTTTPTCPACKMTLSTKKTKTNTVAVKIKGKTYYCCPGCKMNKKK
jgi:YHS domain-containing protein